MFRAIVSVFASAMLMASAVYAENMFNNADFNAESKGVKGVFYDFISGVAKVSIATEDKTWNKPLLIGGYVPLEKIYSYEPLPPGLDDATRSHIIGLQANLWTEYIPWRSLLLYQMLPRAAALAEVQWAAPAQKDYASFLNDRLPSLLRIYSQEGWPYCNLTK